MMRNAFLASLVTLTAATTGCLDASAPVDELTFDASMSGARARSVNQFFTRVPSSSF